MNGVDPSLVQKFLTAINYPASKQTIIDTARNLGADDNIVRILQRLPDQEFNSSNDITEALRKIM